MINEKIYELECLHENQISINDDNVKINQIESLIQRFQLFKNSYEILFLFDLNESEIDVEVAVQEDVIHDDKHRHVVFVDFVNAIHDYDFRVFAQNLLTKLVDKEQSANSFADLIQQNLDKSVVSMQDFEKSLCKSVEIESSLSYFRFSVIDVLHLYCSIRVIFSSIDSNVRRLCICKIISIVRHLTNLIFNLI